MSDDERPRTGSAVWICGTQAPEESARAPREWDSEAEREELCEQILDEQPGLQERELWRALASYRLGGRPGGDRPIGAELASADRRKLSERVRLLIGRLPQDSLQDFRGLVAFTETFVGRVQFVGDLVVYLFAEREKGLRTDGPGAQRYVDFFAQKLQWELDVVKRIAREQPLWALEGEYCDWLVDRVLDGEVLL